ncbi:hypothetical protein C5Y96_14335 [Blastopirellula marina]|uniref:AsmA-like C-terminal domain-containing protein n=1 Tax=Blastopirellula marina TaxID=124 RepID=A0A2S8FES3_9BACT|nr:MULTISPECIES: hypothetical protein [Pirellulaceae]PQO30642.1 hypothetical protein C5Y96_14335 [Blastopirellula marina]RCS50779.1 hypothetical protein DTL36_14345 [Bremerella cremea]
MKKDRTDSTDTSGSFSKWRSLVVVTGLIFLVVMLPSIAAQTPLLSWGIAQATADLNGKVTVDSASLGWFSPIVLNGVEVVDAEGAPVAEIPTIRVSQSLLGLIGNAANLGTIEINQPVLHVTVSEGISNLEQLLPVAESPSKEEEASTSSPRTFRLVVRQGTVHLADGNSSRTWTLEDLAADVDLRDATIPAPCTFSASLRDREQLGVVQGKGTLPTASGEAKFSVVTKGIPLGVAELIGARIGQPVLAQGELNGQMDLVSSQIGPSVLCNLEARGIQMRWLNSDRGAGWSDGTLRVTGELGLAGSHAQANQFTLTTDWGQVLINGRIPTSLTATSSPNASAGQALGDQPWEMRGTVDIARLANAFPELLQIRDGVQLQEGRVTLNLANHIEMGYSSLRAGAVVSNIVAIVNGRHADWQQPLELSAAISMPGDQLQLDAISCRSSFLTADGKTNGPQTDVRFSIDGNRLASDLSRFVDLQGNQVAGTLEGSLQIQNMGGGRVGLAAAANGNDVKWMQGSQMLFAEPRLQTQIQSTIVLQNAALQQIESLNASFQAGTSSLTAQTSVPVILSAETVWPLKLQLQGAVDPIWMQLRGLLGMSDFQLGGNGMVLAKLALGTNQWLIEGVNVDLNDFALVGPATQVHEKKLRVEGSALLDWAAQHFSSQQFTVVGTTISARGTDIHMPLKSGETASGQLAYRVDLSRGMHWVVPPQWLGQNRVAGEMSGTMTLSSDSNGVVIQNNGQIANWELLVPGASSNGAGQPQMQPASASSQTLSWREANLAYMQSLSLNHSEDTLALHECQLNCSAIKLSAKGGVSQLSSVGNVAIQGQADYDWGKISPLVAAIVGPQVQIQGKRTSRFQWMGPLWGSANSSGNSLTISPAWEAAGDVSWQQANLFGIPAGESTLNAQLRQGVLQLTANSPELSGGKLTVNTQLLLNAQPMQWQIPPGRVIENVAITPEMCRSWLHYVAPVVADATRVEGRFSLDVERGLMPVADPIQGESNGVLHIQGAEVRSGPLAQGYVMLARNVEALVKAKPASAIDQGSASLLTLPPQQVRYRVVKGRVYHENLIVQSGDVRVITSGWVDANQQMQMMAAIPIQDSWIEKAPWLASMRGTALNVPISGSMQQPKIDSQVIEQMTRGMIDNAARGALQEGINRGLNELFRPR